MVVINKIEEEEDLRDYLQCALMYLWQQLILGLPATKLANPISLIPPSKRTNNPPTGYNRHSFPCQITLQKAQGFIGSSSDRL